MSETVVLPPELPGDLDLTELNARMRRGEVMLDWSSVVQAPEAALEALLAGLDADAVLEVLGADTIKPPLDAAVEQVLETQAAARDAEAARVKEEERKKRAARRKKGAAPATWRAPNEDGPDAPAAAALAAAAPDATPPQEPQSVLVSRSPAELRDEFERRIRLELLGPAGGPHEEVAEFSLRDRYLLGLLAPLGQEVAPEEQDDLDQGADGDDDDAGGPPDLTAGRPSLRPSSWGITFCVDGAMEEITVTARWGRYARVASATQVTPADGKPLRVWQRVPVEGTLERLALKEGRLDPWAPADDQPDVQVRGLVRRLGGDWVVTLFLVNGQGEPPQNKDSAWLYQTELEVTAPDGRPAFVRRNLRHPGAEQAAPPGLEERVLAMLYRRIGEFAVGHGVSVHAEQAAGDPTRAVCIGTRALPAYEVPRTEPPTAEEIPALASVELDMKALAEATDAQLTEKLQPLADAYLEWIEARTTEAEEASDLAEFQEEASSVLAHCREAHGRIRAGIELLAQDPKAAESFRFMSRAMWVQRVRSRLTEAVRRSGRTQDFAAFDQPEHRRWYPFQLAFILLNLEGVTDLTHRERSQDSDALADLLWFPTGGGKTEAYLGLSAYVMGLRRLQGSVEGRSGEQGVAVLMRYTLRLLTLQQFQRAAALICACEAIRREAWDKKDYRWGGTPFRIGLWVGNRTTPNRTSQSQEAIRQLHGTAGHHGGIATPVQIVHCPWCGHALEAGRDVMVETVEAGRGRTLQYCGDRLGRCLFSRRQSPTEGLPILTVDEELYRNPPTLMIATVDKFAQMPWNGAIQTLFGCVSGRCERHGFRSPSLEDSSSHPATRDRRFPKATTVATGLLRPPDLIIQDELHLISGPLGSLVGLYETAVDRLCSWRVAGKLVRPKLIASTATTRRAPDQVHALFRRQVRVFPPPGLDVTDNFFSRQRIPDDKAYGRRYLGICAPGGRLKAALIRTYVAAMSAAQALFDEVGVRADPWMTVVGYFNSMRQLGGMRRLIDDDVTSRLRQMDRRGLSARRIRPTAVEELTSRRTSSEIPGLLDQLEVCFDPVQIEADREEAKARRQAQAQGKAPPRRAGPYRRPPLDAVLATNMISVGVDVRRLGLMIVCGQPKTTAEYIQATSRVGRAAPGLVLTVLHWARPRDLSHYETFEHYHATFYKHVEALSVTPFASRAVDRGLPGVLAALVRLERTTHNENSGAATVTINDPSVAAVVDAIVERAHAVTSSAETADAVRQDLETLLDDWRIEAQAAPPDMPLGYRRSQRNPRGLLRDPSANEDDGLFRCLNSLRDVEPASGLIHMDGGLEDDLPYPPRGGNNS